MKKKKLIMKRKLLCLSLGAVIVICLAVGVFLSIPEQEELPEELTLSDYPKLFGKEVVIVIGENATQIEIESAEAIAENLYTRTGTMPVLVSDAELTEEEKAKYNLIIVGSPRTNRVFEEVYEITNTTRVTEEYPGENKGVLEILRNPWNEEKSMLLVEGSDDNGVDIIKQITNQTDMIHINRVYGPYKGYNYSRPSGRLGFVNPSGEYCKKLGYKHKIKTADDGSQIGYCVFIDNIFIKKECPAWDFFDGLCGEEYTYCSRTGGIVVKIKNYCPFDFTCALCVLPSGKICYEWDYAMEGCK